MSNLHKRKRDTRFLNKSEPTPPQTSSHPPKKIKIIKNSCDIYGQEYDKKEDEIYDDNGCKHGDKYDEIEDINNADNEWDDVQ